MRIIDLSDDPRFNKEIRQGIKRNKYGNKKTVVDGIPFDSKKEENRWHELNQLVRGKVITDLQRQVKFLLIPTQRDENGNLLEKATYYIADFVYTDTQTGQKIVEDTKGHKTDVYILKRKLMLKEHSIRIREV